jgi:ribokinase
MRVPHHPAPGETLLADAFHVSAGGKGANQAVAAARMGARVSMYGAVGADAYGAEMRNNLVHKGVDDSGVRAICGAVTGCAIITVDRAGQNSICVSPGANTLARADSVPDDALGPASVVVLQMEVVAKENWSLLRRAKHHGARTLLNLAPAQVDQDTLHAIEQWVDFLVVNELEARDLLRATGLESTSEGDEARALSAALNVTAVVTLGAAGACAAKDDDVTRVNALPVNVVDTTGAGDCFVGVFATMLDRNDDIANALKAASAAGSLACTGAGAQRAMPDLETLLKALR